MKICGSVLSLGLVVLFASMLAIPGVGLGQTPSYLDHGGLTRELRAVINGTDLATMTSAGTTLEGRDVWMIEVGSPSGVPHDERPGVLVVGNIEGDHLVGSHLAVEAIRYLVQNQEDPAVQAVLNENVFYFFPRLNPDGAEAMFGSVKWNRKTNGLPWDDDNDGLVNEDGPEDLNGDGFITAMRVADPTGDYLIDPDDPRLMKRADATKHEAGSYTLYWEGTDEDGDGFINEDGPGGVDLNRNFQHAYDYWQADVGPHMVSEIETRALVDFAVSHRNIGAILTFGESDNIVVPPDSRGELASAKVPSLPSFADASNNGVFQTGVFSAGGGGGGFRGRRGGGGGGVYLRGAQPGRDNDPAAGTRPVVVVASADLPYFSDISDLYKKITGIDNVPIHRTPEGAFFQYGYYHYGVPSFSTLGWGLPSSDAGEPAEAGSQRNRGGASEGDKTLLSALTAAGVDAFVDWEGYQHPDLGEVEIGGFVPYVTHNPPAEQIPELGRKHGEFLAELAGLLPKVRIAESNVEALGGGLFKITVSVENTGFFPTSLRHGSTSRAVQQTFVQIQIDADDILSGAEKTANVGIINGSGARSESVTWVLRGREGASVEIKLHSQKGGRDTATLSLR